MSVWTSYLPKRGLSQTQRSGYVGGMRSGCPAKLRKLFVIGAAIGGLALLVARTAADQMTPVNPHSLSMQLIPASDARFLYEGRFDFSQPDAPVVVWQGSRIGIDFEGAALGVRFSGGHGQNFFNVVIDDAVVEVISVQADKDQRIELKSKLMEGRHRLTLFKRSEADVGDVHFGGVEIALGAQASKPVVPAYRLRMEFFGDSIMVGACNEDGVTDQWDDRATHNNALSYTTLTAGQFKADYRCTAVSGMGIATGFVEVRAGEVWNRLYPKKDAPRTNLESWQPDIAFINFGENDGAFPRTKNQPFPENYTAGYVALVKTMRAAYPKTHFVLLRGGMWSGSQSAPLREAWEAAVKQVEADDSAVSHFVFNHWSSTHPRVSDDRILADELSSWLKQQSFMKRFL